MSNICNNYTFLIKESISSEFILSRTCQQFSSIILHFKLKKKKVIPFFFRSIFNGIYVHTFKFVYKLWNAYQNGTKTMNAHWKLIFSLKCLTMYFLKSFLKMKPVTCHLSQRAKISVLSLTVPRFFFGPLLIGINHWRQKKTTFQRHFPQWAPTTENCHLWFSAPAAYLQALLEARWVCGHRATALQSPPRSFCRQWKWNCLLQRVA